MINVATLKAAYAEKLAATGSMDDAFTKAVWQAYKAGLADGAAGISEQEAAT